MNKYERYIAREINEVLAAEEPFDVQLEYVL